MRSYSKEDIERLDQRYRTNLINSLTGFKSVGLIGTQNKARLTNLAVFSQVFHMGAHPPLLGILFRPHSAERHSLENLLETGYCTFNHIQESFVEKAHQTSARYAASEFDACGLTPWYSPSFPAPYLAEANVRLGLRLVEKHLMQVNQTELVVTAIEEIWLPEQCQLPDGYLDLEAAGSVCCSGLDSYHTTQRIARFSYAKPDQPLRTIEPLPADSVKQA